MRIFSTTRSKLITLALVAGIVLVPVIGLQAKASFGPNRPTFTWANPASYITFNSITDNPAGDERTFYTAYEVGTSNRVDPINVRDNEEVAMQVYFHNNAASSLNLVATNTRVKLVLPTGSNTTAQSTAYISADNATPQVVSDTLDMSGDSPFTLTYEPGSAKLWTNYVNGGVLSDSIVTDGALIGSHGADGNVPGCSDFSGYVTIKVRVHVTPPQANFSCSGMDVAEVNRTKFNFVAHATAQNANVTSYVFTAKASNGNVVDTKTVSTSALSAGYTFDQSNPDTYTVSVVVNTDKGSTNAGNCVKQITVQKETPAPVFACTGLTVTTAANRVITATVGVQADNGAKLQSVKYDFGDSVTLMTDQTSVNHTYAKDGSYIVSAVLTFNVGNTTKTASCSKVVTITTPVTPVTPVVLSTTTTLPNTGPGEDVAALFGGASALGAAGHYIAARRNRR